MSDGPVTRAMLADILANRTPRAMAIEHAQHELAAAEAVLALPESQDALRELAKAAAAAFVLRRMRGLPALSIQEQLLQTLEFFGVGASRVCAVAVLLTQRGDLLPAEPADRVDVNLN